MVGWWWMWSVWWSQPYRIKHEKYSLVHEEEQRNMNVNYVKWSEMEVKETWITLSIRMKNSNWMSEASGLQLHTNRGRAEMHGMMDTSVIQFQNANKYVWDLVLYSCTQWRSHFSHDLSGSVPTNFRLRKLAQWHFTMLYLLFDW